MARVTVEDCVLKVPNRFELVLYAAQRARNLAAGEPLAVDRDNDKNPVVALREIAEEAISVDDLREDLIRSYQKYVPADDEPEEEIVEFMAGEQGWPQISDTDAPMVAGADKVVDASELSGDAGEAGAESGAEPAVFDAAEEADKDESP